MLSNKTGKPRKVQIQLLYTPGQKGGWGGEESLSNLRTCKQRNCKILNCKAKETHLIPQEFKYVFQLGYPIPQKDIERHKNLQTYNISTVRLQALSQIASVPNSPGTCWFCHQQIYYHFVAQRKGKHYIRNARLPPEKAREATGMCFMGIQCDRGIGYEKQHCRSLNFCIFQFPVNLKHM